MGWVGVPFEIYFAATSVLVNNFVLLVESYANLAGGNFFGLPASGSNIATFASGVLVLAAIVFLILELRRRIVASAPAPVALDPLAARRLAYVAFWASSFVITSLAFVLSSAPIDANSAALRARRLRGRGALLPLLALRNRVWKATVTAGCACSR